MEILNVFLILFGIPSLLFSIFIIGGILYKYNPDFQKWCDSTEDYNIKLDLSKFNTAKKYHLLYTKKLIEKETDFIKEEEMRL